MTEHIRVLIADDHLLVRDAVAASLDSTEEFDCILASDFKETTFALNEHPDIDVVMLDLVMPGMNGLSSLNTVIKMAGDAKVVLFSGNVTTDFLRKALEAGCAGLIPKALSLNALGNVIKLIKSGTSFVPAQLSTTSAFQSTEASGSHLSERELIILRMVSDGLTNKEIAWNLELADATIMLLKKNRLNSK
jgi:DNA-binding NarL/FixJ family response regulator